MLTACTSKISFSYVHVYDLWWSKSAKAKQTKKPLKIIVFSSPLFGQEHEVTYFSLPEPHHNWKFPPHSQALLCSHSGPGPCDSGQKQMGYSVHRHSQ